MAVSIDKFTFSEGRAVGRAPEEKGSLSEFLLDVQDRLGTLESAATILSAGGLGAVAAYPKTTNGVQTLLAANATDDRVVLVIAKVTQAFTDGDGGQPTFSIGKTGAATAFMATAVFDDATLGQVFVAAGALEATKAVIVTAVAGTVSTETGAIAVTVLALPAAA